MARQPDHLQNDPVVAAIERVLKTERDGVVALRHCATEAQRLLDGAHSQANDIARRTDARISKLHAAYLQKVQRDLQYLTETAAAGDDLPTHELDSAALAEAVRRVAVKLTGGQ